MRIIIERFFVYTVVLSTLLGSLADAVQPVRNLSVTLLGKQYDVSDVTTVKELQKKVEDISGVNLDKQGNVMFGGSILESDAILSDAGVDDGSKLFILPPGLPSKEEMEGYLEKAGISKEKLDEMLKSIGGEGGIPNIQESMKAMADVMNSPMFQDMMSDPDKLEQSRQMILNNPMLKGMLGGMPGMEDLLNDEVAWRQAMQAAASLYKNMDKNDLMKSMLDGASGKGLMDMDLFGSGNGLPTLGNSDSPTTAAALEELDEDD